MQFQFSVALKLLIKDTRPVLQGYPDQEKVLENGWVDEWIVVQANGLTKKIESVSFLLFVLVSTEKGP